MATIQRTRNRGRLTPLEFLICAQAKLAQAQAALKESVSVLRPGRVH